MVRVSTTLVDEQLTAVRELYPPDDQVSQSCLLFFYPEATQFHPICFSCQAKDSWFEGYEWAVLFCEKEAIHLGWRFTSPKTGDKFDALIVSFSEVLYLISLFLQASLFSYLSSLCRMKLVWLYIYLPTFRLA